MRDPFALTVWFLGTAVMAYGFWLMVTSGQGGGAPVLWEVVLVSGGFVASCIGGFAVGRAGAAQQDSVES